MRQEIHAVNSGSVARHHLWASVSSPLYQPDAQLVSEPSTTPAHTVLSITLHTQDYSRMGLVERLSRSHLHWNVPPVSGASVFCGVPLPDCAAASLHRVVKCMLLLVWWPSGITVVDLLCMKAKEVLHDDDFFHGVLWEDRQCERIQKKKEVQQGGVCKGSL